MFSKKALNALTPYKRIFLTIFLDEKEEELITLPAIKNAVFFLDNGDQIIYDDINDLSKLVYIDYNLIESEPSFKEDFQILKNEVKKALSKQKSINVFVIRKVLYGENCQILCKVGLNKD